MKNDMQRMQDRHKLEAEKSKVRVKEAYRQAEQDKYRKFTKDRRKVSESLFDQEAVQSVKLEELVAKLRKQFPELSDAELMELAKMQMGIIDKDIAGKARPIRPSDSGVSLRDKRKEWLERARPPQPAGKKIDLTNDILPPGGKMPMAAPPPVRPAPAGSTVVRTPGGGAVAFPGHIADEAQRKRDYEAYMQQLEMERGKFDAQQRQQEAAVKRQQQEIELRRLQEEFELERLRMEQERKEILGSQPQFGAVSEALLAGRQPVTNRVPTYLGG